jgi:hypothetical protein
MHHNAHVARHRRLVALLLVLCAWFALPAATPARAATNVSIGTIKKDSLVKNESEDYKVRVQKGKQIMIGALNLSLDALSALNDMKVTEVDCPGGAVTPNVNGKGESDGGVVYCTPRGSDDYLDVEFKVKNEKGREYSTTDYAVFVQELGNTASSGQLTLPDDLQSRSGNASPGAVRLYRVAPTVGFNQAKFLLQYAPTGTNNATQMLARFYSPRDGSARCSAALRRESSSNDAATALPTIPVCDPLSADASPYLPYLVVVNYLGGEGKYCLYLANNTTTLVVTEPQENQQHVGKINDCSE